MRAAPFVAPLAVVLAIAGSAVAQPADVTVVLGPDVESRVAELGARDVDSQVDALTAAVRSALARDGALQGAQVRLVLTDLKPNRPTMQQTIDTPGLDPLRSISIGGAAIEGEIVMPDGARRPIAFERYSSSIREVIGQDTWGDARRAYRIFAGRLADGRL